MLIVLELRRCVCLLWLRRVRQLRENRASGESSVSRGSKGLAKVLESKDTDASLKAEWVVADGRTISKGLQAELEVSWILVAVEKWVKL